MNRPSKPDTFTATPGQFSFYSELNSYADEVEAERDLYRDIVQDLADPEQIYAEAVYSHGHFECGVCKRQECQDECLILRARKALEGK